MLVSSPRLPPKKEVLTKLLEQWSVMVHLDPRPTEVRVPSGFKKQPQLALQIGLNLPVPIRDLQIDDEGISCTLSFNRSPHFCFVPWSAVFALVGEDSRGMVWPESVPSEITLQQTNAAPPNAAKSGSGEQGGAQKRSASQGNSSQRSSSPGKRPARATAAPKRAALKAVPGGPAESAAPVVAAPIAAGPVAAPVPAGVAAAPVPGDSPAEPAAQPAAKAPRPSYLRVVK